MIPIIIKENKLNPDTSVSHVYLHHRNGDCETSLSFVIILKESTNAF